MTAYRTSLLSGGRVLFRTSGQRVRGGAWVHAACSPPRVALETFLGRLAAASPRLLPGKTVDWDPPLERSRLRSILDAAGDMLGEDLIVDVVVLPTDPRRQRFGLLLSGQESRTQLAFAKFSTNPLNPFSKVSLALLEKARVSWWFPRVIAAGTEMEWSYEITSALPARPHRPARLTEAALHQIALDIRHALLPLSRDVGESLCHGDFGPWNVRALRNGPTAVIDWEDLRPAPAPTDELWWLTTTSLLGNESRSLAAVRIGEYLSLHYSPRESIEAIDALTAHIVRPQPPEVGEAGPDADVLSDQERYIAMLAATRRRVDRLP